MGMVAQIFALFSGVLMVSSLNCKTKEEMLKVQAADAVCAGIASMLLCGWTAVVLDVLAVVRNLVKPGGKRKRVIASLWCIAGLVTVLWEKAGIAPLLSSAVYTVTIYYCSLGWTKAALASSLGLWALYDFFLGAYPLAVSDCIALAVILAGARKTAGDGSRLFSLTVHKDDNRD